MARKENRNRDRVKRSASHKRWHDDLAPETKKSVLAVIFFALAVITVLAYWGRAGFLGNIIFKSLEFAVGRAYFLAPITFLLTGTSLLFSFRRHLFAGTFIGAGLFLASGLALIELFFNDRSGGWIGFLVDAPLERIFDFWATLVIESAALIVSALIMANIPLLRLRDEAADLAGAKPEPVAPEPAAPLGAVQKKPAEHPAAGSAVMVETVEAESRGREEEFSIAKKRGKKFSYIFPPLNLLNDDKGTPSSGDIRANANIIKRTLLNFGIDVEMGEVSIGPTVTQYTLKPAEGMKLARIVALQNDLSLALAAHPIRIEAPIPGKSLVGIEVPNRSIALVGLRSLLENDIFQKSESPLLFVLGRDVAGAPVYANLAKMPHLLVAGATGAGKSVAIHSMITSFIYRNPPELLKFLMVDPKRVELAVYNGIPHLLTPPITDPKKTIQALRWAVREMEQRYEMLSSASARDLQSYNERVAKKGTAEEELMPYLVVVIDELADLMVAFPREVEGSIIRLAQMARAVGIHLVVSTQRPSVEVITGLIKANITSRLAFQVASQVDSRTILDIAGAEKLLGNGDMLFLAGDTAKPRRIQGGFVSEGEVQRIIKFIREEAESAPAEEDIFKAAPDFLAASAGEEDEFGGEEDPLYEEARRTVIQARKASASYLQRRLKIGYARAARLLDILEERGVIGPGEGAKPREIFVKDDAARA
ncbi:MAG: DNA translocase FtsK [Candidatus Sungbacteria bacterium]|uniref:DNA translocase FtsK n=1 Tax=Candidatus Sungiibacteriota bacterium TaxID=2750080 RepID=A0A932YYP3_9BACT|nr:DNA translocase FtsK [Candidatus Sungbacteria bacterium]